MIGIRVDAPRLRDALGRFARIEESARTELAGAVGEATELVYREARRNVRTTFKTAGRMPNAIRMVVNAANRKVPYGEVYVEGLRYTIHETGGRGSYLIYPRNKKALRFSTGSAFTYAAKVLRRPVPRRSFLQRAFDETRVEVRAIFEEARRRIVR